MIRLFLCVRRRADIDAPEFRRRWVEPMREVAAAIAKASGAQRHALSVTLELPENQMFIARQGFAAAFDAVVELEYADGATARAALGDPEVDGLRATLRQLAASYLDVAGTSVFYAQDA